MRIRLGFGIVCCACLLGCGAGPEQPFRSGEKTTVLDLVIVDYSPAVLEVSDENGIRTVCDAAVCEIRSPAHLRGDRLQIWGWNLKGGPLPEVMRSPGNTLRIECNLDKRQDGPCGVGPTGFGLWQIKVLD